MRLKVMSQKECAAGLLFMAIGVGWGSASLHYQLGNATDMGPGYFPLAVSVALVFLGACSVIRSLRVVDEQGIGAWPFRSIISILLGIVAFALLVVPFGLVAASVALIVLSCYQRILTRPLELAVLTAGLVIMVVALFIYALDLPFDIF